MNQDHTAISAPAVPIEKSSSYSSRWPALQIVLAVTILIVTVMGGLVLAAGKQAIWIVLISSLFPMISVTIQSIIERLLTPAGPRKSFQSWLLHFQINAMFNFLLSLFTVAAFLGCSALARHFGFELGLFDIRFASGKGLLILIGSLWLSTILGDFFFYWYHRWTHVNQFLWQHHKMHHTDIELEAISTARQNWLEAVFDAVLVAAPMILLFKVDPNDQWNTGILAGVTAAFVTNILTLSHMNVRWQVGWFSRLWCSPQIHRIHHSLAPEHIDKNFAFSFPLWDVIFGTYYHPKKDEFPATGVAGEDGFGSFLEAQIYTPREMYRYLRRKFRPKAEDTDEMREGETA